MIIFNLFSAFKQLSKSERDRESSKEAKANSRSE